MVFCPNGWGCDLSFGKIKEDVISLGPRMAPLPFIPASSKELRNNDVSQDFPLRFANAIPFIREKAQAVCFPGWDAPCFWLESQGTFVEAFFVFGKEPVGPGREGTLN